MFVTLDAYRLRLPLQLGPADEQFYLAVALSTEAPWFLVSHRAEETDVEIVQTVAVAWEATLISIVEVLGAERVVSVRRIRGATSVAGAWEMQDIHELWVPSEAEGETTGPLLYRVRGENVLRDSFGATLSFGRDDRHLLARLDQDGPHVGAT